MGIIIEIIIMMIVTVVIRNIVNRNENENITFCIHADVQNITGYSWPCT